MFKNISESIKRVLGKEQRHSCLVWDGKIINYLNLTDREIAKMKSESTNKELMITKKDEL